MKTLTCSGQGKHQDQDYTNTIFWLPILLLFSFFDFYFWRASAKLGKELSGNFPITPPEWRNFFPVALDCGPLYCRSLYWKHSFSNQLQDIILAIYRTHTASSVSNNRPGLKHSVCQWFILILIKAIISSTTALGAEIFEWCIRGKKAHSNQFDHKV